MKLYDATVHVLSSAIGQQSVQRNRPTSAIKQKACSLLVNPPIAAVACNDACDPRPKARGPQGSSAIRASLGILLLLIGVPPLPAQTSFVPAEQQVPDGTTSLTPRIDGPWIQLVGRPPLEKWASPDAEPVDFTIFQADNGRWQLIACVRKTAHPGSGRLLYRWSSPELTRTDWKPEGIFLSSMPEWNHAEGVLQAPFHVKNNGQHYLFYNSRGAHLLRSSNGIDFEPVGTTAVFPMGRDVCLLDDRDASGKWIAYYTSPEKGINPATKDHTIRARTATYLEGPWSDTAIEVPPITSPPTGYKFVYAESPLVIKRGGSYFRFEQLFVFRSNDPLKWQGPPAAVLAPKDAIKRLAPEIVSDHGRDFLVAYQWRGKDPRGIYLAPLAWDRNK